MATLFIGQNKVFLPETESTNSYAINLLKNVKCFEGTAVYTHNQTAGKGQRGNAWHSQPSMNCTLSLILKPDFLSAKNSFYLSKITALAIHDVLAALLNKGQFDIKIKWPNDILVNRKKIAGILIENQFQDEKLKWSVVGIGLNINQVEFEKIIATSTAILIGKKFVPDDINELIFECFERWYLMLKAGHETEINKAYLGKLFGYNETLNFTENNQSFTAKIVNVTVEGLIELELQNGQTRLFEIKQIQFAI